MRNGDGATHNNEQTKDMAAHNMTTKTTHDMPINFNDIEMLSYDRITEDKEQAVQITTTIMMP